MKKKVYITISLLIVLLLLIINIIPKKEDKKLEEVKVVKKQFAIYKQKDDKSGYELFNGTKFPTDMVYNSTLSYCLDNKGDRVNNILTFNNGKASITSNKTVYCTLYFDINDSVSAYIPRLFASTNDTSKISKYTGPVTDECSANSCTTIQQAQNVYVFTSNDINNVIFEGYCWKIIRTTETKGLKLLYNGTPITVDDHQECTMPGTNTILTSAQMNTSSNDITYSHGGGYDKLAYVGYMYNPDSLNSTYYDQIRADNVNQADSLIKEKTEYWFHNNSGIDESKLEDAVYCNDRSLAESGGYTSPVLEAQLATATSGDIRFKNRYQILSSTLECTHQTDSFNTANTKAQTNYKVGFITVPEYSLIGKSTLSGSGYFWIGTPSIYSINDGANVYFVYPNGNINSSAVYGGGVGLRPVVSLNSSVQITGGEGSTTSPFIFE